MQELIVFFGILIGITWHIMMPFLEKYLYAPDEITEPMLRRDLLTGMIALLYAVPLAMALFFSFQVIGVSDMQAFILAFTFGYTAYNLTSERTNQSKLRALMRKPFG